MGSFGLSRVVNELRAKAVFFFSNRMGCLKSLVISVIGTLILLLVLGVIRLPGQW